MTVWKYELCLNWLLLSELCGVLFVCFASFLSQSSALHKNRTNVQNQPGKHTTSCNDNPVQWEKTSEITQTTETIGGQQMFLYLLVFLCFFNSVFRAQIRASAVGISACCVSCLYMKAIHFYLIRTN